MSGFLIRPLLCGGLQLGRPRHAITPAPHRPRYRVVTKTSSSYGEVGNKCPLLASVACESWATSLLFISHAPHLTKELEGERELREKAELAPRAQLGKTKRAEKALEDPIERTERVKRAMKRQMLFKDLKLLGVIVAGVYLFIRVFWQLKVVYGL